MGKSKKIKKLSFKTIRRYDDTSYKNFSSTSFCSEIVNEKEHQRRLGVHAAELWEDNKITDIEVKLHGLSYPAHKTVLSCYSKYFRKHLLVAKSNAKTFNVRLDSVTNEAFEILLNFMYKAELHVNVQNLGDVYIAAQKLGMDDAVEACAEILKGNCFPEVHCVYVYTISQKLDLKDTEDKALEAMCIRFEQIVGTPEFLQLDITQVKKYLSSDVLATRSEVIVFLAALKWISVEFLEREEFACDVIGCVRFSTMTLEEILACYHPPLLPGIMEQPQIKFWLLRGTCYAAAKTVNAERLFQAYSCVPRTYLLPRAPIILWDPNIFDPDRYENYSKEAAATKLQAAYRGYRTRKSFPKKKKAIDVLNKSSDESLSKVSVDYSVKNTDNYKEREDDENEDKTLFSPISFDFENLKNFFKSSDSSSISDDDQKDHSQRKKHDETDRLKRDERRVDETGSEDESEDRYQNDDADEKDSSDLESEESTPKKWKGRIVKMPENGKTRYGLKFDVMHDVRKDRRVKQTPHYQSSTENENSNVEDLHSNIKSKEQIIVVGGVTENAEDDKHFGKSVYLFDPSANNWTLSHTKRPIYNHCLVYLDGGVFVIGGCNPLKDKGSMVAQRKCYRLDLSNKRWTKIPSMHEARMYHSAASLGGKIYAVGGKNENHEVLSSIEVYDPNSNAWELQIESLDKGVLGMALCSHNGELWMIGGMVPGNDGELKTSRKVKCYDPQKQEWHSNVRRLPHSRARVFSAAVEYEGMVCVIGGAIEDEKDAGKEKSIEDVLYYDESAEKWKELTFLPWPRHFMSAMTIGNSLFVIGGLNSEGKILYDDILIYKNRTWSVFSVLPRPLCGFAAVSVPMILSE